MKNGHFLPLLKIASKFDAFETLKNLENDAPVYIKHRFSRFGPILKMSPKLPQKTSLLATSWPQNRRKWRKGARLKMPSKNDSRKYEKATELSPESRPKSR